MNEFIDNLGENIRRVREEKNMSMRRLAQFSKLSPTAIQKIENNKMVPSVVVMYKIAHALNKKMSSFLGEDPENGKAIHLTRRSRKKIKISHSHSVVEIISGGSENWTLQAAIHTLAEGGKSGTETIAHRGEELVFCLAGRIKFSIEDQTFILKKDDSLHFISGLPHSWENIHKGTSKMILLAIPPLR
ncbi:MAG: cupin domain-containing protein [Candidatus Adiutricales bacterium]